jgi:hypothetical protein
MDITSERTVSGRSLVVAGLVVVALVTAASFVLGPGLRNEVRQSQDPRTLREPIAEGMHQGQPWEAVGRFDGTANCVELRYLGKILDRACDSGPATVTTAVPRGGPTVAYGTTDDEAATHTVSLDNGEQLDVPVKAGDLGFPVGFWAVELPAGTGLAD